MNNKIISSGGFVPSSTDTPLDVRTRVQSVDDIYNIDLPYVGMIVYVIDENKYYKIKTLKAKEAGIALIENSSVDTFEEFIIVGPQGPQGEQGLQGEPGPAGKDFTFDMFTPEQLESLKGPQGDKGDKGDRGPQGEPGPVIDTNANILMLKNNPIATGTFSLNRNMNSDIGESSSTLGESCIASGYYSHAEGLRTEAIGTQSHAEGHYTKAVGLYSHAEGENALANGSGSHAEGCFTTAEGVNSHAEGKNTLASGGESHAEGLDTIASGSYSHAEGIETKASGSYSHAEGLSTVASNNSAHAEGFNTVASGHYSHAEGASTTASGMWSHAEGRGATADGECAHAEGHFTTALHYDHAEGDSTIASGGYSHAEGSCTESKGVCSHAEGSNTISLGRWSHAEGCYSTANGDGSHAEGFHTQALGKYSHSEGLYTIASSDSQHVQGKFNIEDKKNIYAHIVGNGTNSEHSNAHTLDWNGNAWFQGDVFIKGTSQDDGQKLATEDMVIALQQEIAELRAIIEELRNTNPDLPDPDTPEQEPILSEVVYVDDSLSYIIANSAVSEEMNNLTNHIKDPNITGILIRPGIEMQNNRVHINFYMECVNNSYTMIESPFTEYEKIFATHKLNLNIVEESLGINLVIPVNELSIEMPFGTYAAEGSEAERQLNILFEEYNNNKDFKPICNISGDLYARYAPPIDKNNYRFIEIEHSTVLIKQ